jgi:hypothetical protein
MKIKRILIIYCLILVSAELSVAQAQAQRAKERGWPVQQLTADHNAQWSAPEALVEMLAHIQ